MSVVSQREQPTTIVISAGMAMITFVAWYSYRLGIQIYVFITVAVAIAIILAGIITFKYIRSAENQKRATISKRYFNDFYIIIAIISVFTVQSIIAFKFIGEPIGRLHNNDIFAWALIADHFLGNANINNITPGGAAYLNSSSTDAWGTFFNLAMAAKMGGRHSLEATPSFVVMCLTLITFTLYEITKKAFALPSTVALIVATLTGAGSFVFYIAYNGFYGQLLGTIFFLNLIHSILNSYDKIDDYLTNTATFFLSITGLLLVYQSGFFVFGLFSIVFCMLQSIHNRYFTHSFTSTILTKSHTPIYQLLLALTISLTLLPELSWYTIQRTIVVSDVMAGWPLPLISPAYLLSLPVWLPFPKLQGSIVHYGLAALFFGLVVFNSLIQLKKNDIKMPVAAFSLISLLGLSISIYALAYYIKGGVYQTWKLAAFIVIPSSFAINALIAKSVYVVCSFKSKKTNLIVLTFFILMSLINFVSIPFRSILDPYSSKIYSLKAIKETALAQNVKTIILGTPAYGDTMAAFNYLSKDFKLIPLSQSYISSTNISDLNSEDKKITRLLIPAKCEGNQSDASKSRYILTTGLKLTFEKFNFNAVDLDCSFYSGVTLGQGFSSSESWGTWTIGDRASIEVIVPIDLQGKDLVTKFEINPFDEQSVVIKGNGVILGNYVLKGQTNLTIKVPSELPKSNKIIFDFTISNPRLAREFYPDNHDPRLLGLGFVSMMLTDSSLKHNIP